MSKARAPRRTCKCGCGQDCRSNIGYARGHAPLSSGEGATKPCQRCGAIRLLVDFYPDLRMRDGRRSWCKACDRTRVSKKRLRIKENDPNGLKEVERRRQIQKTYGISAEQFQAIFDAQDGACFICRRRPVSRALSVDHDHKCCPGKQSCGKCVRALLCNYCNRVLGHLRDDPKALRRAVDVLEKRPAQAALGAFGGKQGGSFVRPGALVKSDQWEEVSLWPVP